MVEAGAVIQVAADRLTRAAVDLEDLVDHPAAGVQVGTLVEIQEVDRDRIQAVAQEQADYHKVESLLRN